jgi:hypothetical protein
MSNVGKWNDWYRNVDPNTPGSFRYGDTVTYRMAAAFFVGVPEVEDWGCGTAGLKRFYQGKYVGVDGSQTPFANKISDLCTYESSTDGVFIRHVLEHNYEWEKILAAAVRSFRQKLCLVLFTPFTETTHEIAHNRAHGVDVPDLSFCRVDIERHFGQCQWQLDERIPTDTGYGIEHVYFVWR